MSCGLSIGFFIKQIYTHTHTHRVSSFTHVATFLRTYLFQNVMKDPWLNVGYEENELKPFEEPSQVLDDKRIGWHSFLKSILDY